MWFSYPGYNEILTGKADDQNIFSNDKIPNPNETILEQFAKTYDPLKVAAFGSWDVFDYIVNQEDQVFILIVVLSPQLTYL
jgi:hypothetical protein